MSYAIRILLIGDEGAERDKIQHTLSHLYSKSKIDVIDTFERLKQYHDLSELDIVICDFNLSDCDGIDILFYVREREFQLPFIFVSNIVWEEATIDTLVLNGVSDYVSANNLKELEFIVRREVNRYNHVRNTKIKLQVSDHRFRTLVQSINGIVREMDLETLQNVYVSPQSMNILGYAASDWLENRHFWVELIHPKDRSHVISTVNKIIKKGGDHTLEYRMISSEGDTVWIRDLLTVRKDNGIPVSLNSLMIDITKEKEIEYQRDLALQSEKRRMKEQKCLWNITNLDELTLSIPQLIQRSLIHIPIGFQYPNIVGVKIVYGEDEYVTSNYEESEISIKSQHLKLRSGELSIEVVYLDSEPLNNQKSPFLKEERHLLDTISDILAIKIEKKRSTDDLKKHEQLLINTYELAQLGRMI